MRKGTLFISVVLTTFMLAVLFGVASAYQKIITSKDEVAAEQPTAAVDLVSAPVAPAAAVPTQIAPEVAADIAAKVIGQTDLYSVEVTQFEGADAYLVTFSSRDIVYMSLDGRVLSISELPVTVVTQRRRNNNNDEPNAPVVTTSDNGGEDHEDHEDEDD